jgi:hypothetical protein
MWFFITLLVIGAASLSTYEYGPFSGDRIAMTDLRAAGLLGRVMPSTTGQNVPQQ